MKLRGWTGRRLVPVTSSSRKSLPLGPDADFPRDLEAWRATVVAARAAGDLSRALAETEEMATRYPDRAEIHSTLGELHRENGDAPATLAALQRVLALKPDDTKNRLRLARALRATGAYQEALEIILPVAEATPTAATLTKVAGLYRRLHRHDEALAQLQRAVALNRAHKPAWQDMISLLDELDRTDEADEARRSLAAIVPKLSAAEVVERIDAVYPDHAARFVVNIGCRDGKGWDDPCYELYQDGYPGLAVDAGHFPDLHRNLPQPSVRKVLGTALTPANVLTVLQEGECPERLSLLKIDVDSFDGALLDAALTGGLRPNVIQIEVHPQIPPPLRFAIQYDPRYRHSGKAGFFGCSVSYVVAICRPRGYELLEIDFSDPPRRQDVILVKREYLDLWDVAPPVDERALFLAEPVATGLFQAVGADPWVWREQTDYAALLSDVWDACVAASLKRSDQVLPFLLSL